jgi:hypothetical protein
MEVANTLAYFNMATITTVKMFAINCPGETFRGVSKKLLRLNL